MPRNALRHEFINMDKFGRNVFEGRAYYPREGCCVPKRTNPPKAFAILHSYKYLWFSGIKTRFGRIIEATDESRIAESGIFSKSDVTPAHLGRGTCRRAKAGIKGEPMAARLSGRAGSNEPCGQCGPKLAEMCQKRAKSEPKASQKRAKSEPKASQKRAKSEPKASQSEPRVSRNLAIHGPNSWSEINGPRRIFMWGKTKLPRKVGSPEAIPPEGGTPAQAAKPQRGCAGLARSRPSGPACSSCCRGR
jgi:hypothetical protein